jgi:hypothetical protein
MERNFLTDKEFVALKNWLAVNGFTLRENPEEDILLSVKDGQYNLHVSPTTEPDLYEVHDNSIKGSSQQLLSMFYKHEHLLGGVEIPTIRAARFVPASIKPHLGKFDHFRIRQRQDKLWDLLGCVGFHAERIAICDYKLPLKVFGGNFQETYWTLIYTAKKESKDIYARN